MEIYIISVSVFLAFFFFVFGVLYFLSRRKDPVRRRLKDLKEGEDIKDKDAKLSLTLLSDTEQAKGTRIWLAQAGYRGPSSVSNYYGGISGAFDWNLPSHVLGRRENPQKNNGNEVVCTQYA